MVIRFKHPRLLHLDEFSFDQLIYRGEGNSSLVIAIKSTFQVIRLLKSDAKKLQNASDVLTHLLQHIDFNIEVLPYVLPNYLFSSPTLICLNEYQLDMIKMFIKDKRPSFRLDKTLPNCGFALLMTDYCSIARSISYDYTKQLTFAIEIKPKQGFLPIPDLFCSNDILKLKSRICRYGLSQFYKLQKQSINSFSSYCPLDLFSGCQSRMVFSLLSLLKNPQNNLRIFANSHLIYDDSSKIDDLYWILHQFFYKSNNLSHQSNTNVRNPLTAFIFILLKILTKPLTVDNENIPKIYEKRNRIDFNYLPNVYRQFLNLNSIHNYVYFRSFIQIFEQISLNTLDNVFCLKDYNNNILPLNEFNFQFNLNPNNFKYNSTNQGMNNINQKFKMMNNQYRQNYFDDLRKISTETKTNSSSFKSQENCLLHRKKNIPLFETEFNLKCDCKDLLSSHNLPSGCILHSILLAQKLDSIDSFIAAEIFHKLYFKYTNLKNELGVDNLYPINNNSNNNNNNNNNFNKKSLEQFILENVEDFDMLWRFLISLTAKDCSIMIAMKQCPMDGCQCSTTMSPSNVHINDSNTGRHYMARLSLIDLDNKPAYKILRTLHNDRRMINSFLHFLDIDPDSFSLINVIDKINSKLAK